MPAAQLLENFGNAAQTQLHRKFDMGASAIWERQHDCIARIDDEMEKFGKLENSGELENFGSA